MHTKTLLPTSILALGLALASDGASEVPVAEAAPFEAQSLAGLEHNGVSLQGIAMNGIGLDAVGLQGKELATDVLTPLGGYRNGVSLIGLRADRSGFVASTEDDDEMVEVSGAELAGAQLRFARTTTTVTGETVESDLWVKILAVESIDASTLAHHVLVYDDAADAWTDPCSDNGGLGLIPLRGTWDLRTGDALGGDDVTLACRGDVLAKCVEWGYHPWRSSESADLHQACTRMARADYCGDGTPMTVDGTPIDVYDSLGIQESVTHWPVEAEWGPDGATCVAGNVLRPSLLGLDEPECMSELYDRRCGALVGESRLANRYGG